MADLWDQQSDETARAYSAFRCYRDMFPIERSVSQVAQQLRRSRTLICRWSAKHSWVDRCRAFDAHVQQSELEELQAARRDMRRRHVAIARVLFKKCAEGISVLRQRKVSPAALARLTEIAADLERRALGESRDDEPVAAVSIIVRKRTAEDDKNRM